VELQRGPSQSTRSSCRLALELQWRGLQRGGRRLPFTYSASAGLCVRRRLGECCAIALNAFVTTRLLPMAARKGSVAGRNTGRPWARLREYEVPITVASPAGLGPAAICRERVRVCVALGWRGCGFGVALKPRTHQRPIPARTPCSSPHPCLSVMKLFLKSTAPVLSPPRCDNTGGTRCRWGRASLHAARTCPQSA
jgi:hypothetical protein